MGNSNAPIRTNVFNKAIKRVVIVLLVFLFLLASFPTAILAAPPAAPDSVSMLNYYVNRNLVETGDALFVVKYQITYASVPTQTADQLFAFRLFSTDGVTEMGVTLPYPYVTGGYGQGVVAFYFSASDGIVWDSPYILKVSGNPAYFTTIPEYSFVIPPSAYSTYTTQADNQAQLGLRIITIAGQLQVVWGVSTYVLVSQQDAGPELSTQGEEYFRNAIYGLQALAPSIFYIQFTDSVQDKPTMPGTSLSDSYKDRFKDTWVYDSVESGAHLFHIPIMLFLGIIVLGACIFLIYKSNKTFQTPMPGYFASAVAIVGFSLLWLGMTLIALVIFACLFISGWLLFFKKA